jgi:hypothetical protein
MNFFFNSPQADRLIRMRLRRRGVILVLVLLLIAICGTVTSQIFSRVTRLSGQAADAQRELQNRWSIVSLRRTLLIAAPKLLSVRDKEAIVPIREREFRVLLSGTRYSVTLQDESSKVPYKRLMASYSSEQLKPFLRSLVGDAFILKSVLPKRPTMLSEIADRKGVYAGSESLQSWQQLGDTLTLWTEGPINLRTAPKEVIDELWRLQFHREAPESVGLLGQSNPENGFGDQVRSAGLSPTEAQFATVWFGNESNTYSLWIDAANERGSGFTAIYVRHRAPGFADEQYGFHYP